jgi:hypothetical protein
MICARQFKPAAFGAEAFGERSVDEEAVADETARL